MKPNGSVRESVTTLSCTRHLTVGRLTAVDRWPRAARSSACVHAYKACSTVYMHTISPARRGGKGWQGTAATAI